jgi:hypothetical protein
LSLVPADKNPTVQSGMVFKDGTYVSAVQGTTLTIQSPSRHISELTFSYAGREVYLARLAAGPQGKIYASRSFYRQDRELGRLGERGRLIFVAASREFPPVGRLLHGCPFDEI